MHGQTTQTEAKHGIDHSQFLFLYTSQMNFIVDIRIQNFFSKCSPTSHSCLSAGARDTGLAIETMRLLKP